MRFPHTKVIGTNTKLPPFQLDIRSRNMFKCLCNKVYIIIVKYSVKISSF